MLKLRLSKKIASSIEKGTRAQDRNSYARPSSTSPKHGPSFANSMRKEEPQNDQKKNNERSGAGSPTLPSLRVPADLRLSDLRLSDLKSGTESLVGEILIASDGALTPGTPAGLTRKASKTEEVQEMASSQINSERKNKNAVIHENRGGTLALKIQGGSGVGSTSTGKSSDHSSGRLIKFGSNGKVMMRTHRHRLTQRERDATKFQRLQAKLSVLLWTGIPLEILALTTIAGTVYGSLRASPDATSSGAFEEDAESYDVFADGGLWSLSLTSFFLLAYAWNPIQMSCIECRRKLIDCDWTEGIRRVN
eukprot:CAMPEP_0185281812 /NCGR_PEP_ID=MMETSP1359-20130426/66928_1 /TAXON_ID=552665 /ORGANISM="Bigelowiella longifila, Strain CCMP242" /LENGTH=306 /DNA_ID=CAMNT_0027877289 /DNA_START=663 /DNA_END=1583 /DNA_ORIENTATION=-